MLCDSGVNFLRRSCKFSPTPLSILTRRIHEIIRIEDAIPKIIERDMFDEIQEKMQKRKKEFIGHKAIETYLLTGKIICGKCGGKYCGFRRKDGRNKNLMVRYGCGTRQRKGKAGCDSKDIRREYIEALVLDELEQHIFDENLLPVIYAQFTEYNESLNHEKNKAVQAIQTQMQTIDKDIKSVVNLLMQTSSKTLLDKLNTLEDEKAGLERKFYELKAANKNTAMTYGEIISMFNGAKAMFQDGTLESIKRLIEVLIQAIRMSLSTAVMISIIVRVHPKQKESPI